MNRDKHNRLLTRIQNYMMSYSGKTLINYFYSWGAAVVILGTLFKLTHLPGANLMLYIGMGTEVLVFIISGFDRPTKTYRWESVFPNLEIAGRAPKKPEHDDESSEAPASELPESVLQAQSGTAHEAAPAPAAGTAPQGTGPSVVYVGGGAAMPAGSTVAGESITPAPQAPMDSEEKDAALSGGSQPVFATSAAAFGGSMPQWPNIPAEELEEATQEYLDKLKEMTETLTRLNEQLSGFVCDPEQMEGVNRHIAGLNAIFELQLRSASKQVESVDKVHEQTEQMAAQIEELNKVYARMLQAMTANMVRQQPINQ